MNSRDVIQAQGRAVLDNVYDARRLLGAFQPGPGPVDDMRIFFAGRLDRISSDADSVINGTRNATHHDADLWKALGGLQKDVREIGLQLLAYLEGGLLRGLVEFHDENAVWHVADALLIELSTAVQIPWQRFTMPGTEEYIDTETQMIRLSCPGFSLWDLPIAAHEFGHYAGPQIKPPGLGMFPFGAMRSSRSDKERNHLDEFFGDVFAVHVGGPAYACNSIVMRFSPMSKAAENSSDTHPSYNERVAVMMAALRAAALYREEEHRDPDWAWVIDQLEETWHAGMMLAGKNAQLHREREKELDALLGRLLNDVLAHVPPYDRWASVCAATEILVGDPQRRPRLNADVQLRDVLNIAWLARLRRPADIVSLERFLALNARAVAATIVARPISQHGRGH